MKAADVEVCRTGVIGRINSSSVELCSSFNDGGCEFHAGQTGGLAGGSPAGRGPVRLPLRRRVASDSLSAIGRGEKSCGWSERHEI